MQKSVLRCLAVTCMFSLASSSSWCAWQLSRCRKTPDGSHCRAQFVRDCRCPTTDGPASCAGPAVRNATLAESAALCQSPLCFERGLWCAWGAWGPSELPCGRKVTARRSRDCCRLSQPSVRLLSRAPCALVTSEPWWQTKEVRGPMCDLFRPSAPLVKVFGALVAAVLLVWATCCVVTIVRKKRRGPSRTAPVSSNDVTTSLEEGTDLPPSYSQAELHCVPSYESAVAT